MKRGGRVFSKYQIKRYGGREYVIFDGYPGLRRHLRRSRYWANHPKVVSFGIGRSGLANLAKGGLVVSVFISAGFRLVDTLLSDQKTWRHFVSGVVVDVIFAVALAGLAWGAAATLAGIATMVTVGPLVAMVVAGVFFTYAFNNFNAEVFVDKMADKLELFEQAMNQSHTSAKAKLSGVRAESNSDPVGFIHRLLGVPQSYIPR